jgi:hypothetical protein
VPRWSPAQPGPLFLAERHFRREVSGMSGQLAAFFFSSSRGDNGKSRA